MEGSIVSAHLLPRPQREGHEAAPTADRSTQAVGQLRHRVAAGTVIGGFAVALIAIVHALGLAPWA